MRATGFIMSARFPIGELSREEEAESRRRDDKSRICAAGWHQRRGYLGCKNVRVRNLRGSTSSLTLVGHLRLFVLHQDARDKRNVCTYRSSEITTVIRDPLMVGPARLVYLRKYVNHQVQLLITDVSTRPLRENTPEHEELENKVLYCDTVAQPTNKRSALIVNRSWMLIGSKFF